MINSITPLITPIMPKPEHESIQHIENLERIRKRRAEELRHIDTACSDRMGQKRVEHRKVILLNLTV